MVRGTPGDGREMGSPSRRTRLSGSLRYRSLLESPAKCAEKSERILWIPRSLDGTCFSLFNAYTPNVPALAQQIERDVTHAGVTIYLTVEVVGDLARTMRKLTIFFLPPSL